jgi:hypothetical protein
VARLVQVEIPARAAPRRSSVWVRMSGMRDGAEGVGVRTGSSVSAQADILFDTLRRQHQLERAGIGEIMGFTALASDHAGPTCVETQRRLPDVAGAAASTRDGRLPAEQVAADHRRWLGDGAPQFMASRGWIRIHELADGETVQPVRSGSPFRLTEDYVYAFELRERGRRVLVAMDGLTTVPPPGCAASTAVLPWGSANDLFTGDG